jgi:hypothetical protein
MSETERAWTFGVGVGEKLRSGEEVPLKLLVLGMFSALQLVRIIAENGLMGYAEKPCAVHGPGMICKTQSVDDLCESCFAKFALAQINACQGYKP